MLSVIIVNYNSAGRLVRCIRHLERQTFRDFEIIVFDNASSDASAQAARENGAVRVIESAANLGFAAANNRAAEAAKGDWLVFLNPDAYADEAWLERLVEARSRYGDADAFGSTQLNADDPERIDGAGDVLHAFGIAYRGGFGAPVSQLPEDGECFSPCAAAAMIRKSAFDALGGFDERFFCYGEDVDLGLRLRLLGGRAIQVADARVLHEGSGVTGRHSAFTVYHGHRNRIWLARKNFPAAFFWGALPMRLLTDIALLIRMMLIGEARAYLRAMRDGYFGGGPIRSLGREFRRSMKPGLMEFLSMMSWSPVALARRAPQIRPATAARAGKADGVAGFASG
ncbi:MAG: glycosyltransferase family 2 protein [Parvularculaceae bacterium]|nr:glycosyltransferase family 2 protein [Parvularculaceae bacterium]